MATLRMASLPSMRKQHLMAEFTGLKQACPDSIYITLTPGDPSLWQGVMFVRKGPFSSAVFRFTISFPDAYPRQPPLVTFQPDVFHPLVCSSSGYTAESETISAAEEELLPSGGFSLRHGFPAWFTRRRSRKRAGMEHAASILRTPPRNVVRIATDGRNRSGSIFETPLDAFDAPTPAGERPGYTRTDREAVPVYDVLAYIRSTFDDEEVLDSLPEEAAVNNGAWQAWKVYRKEKMLGGQELPSFADTSVMSENEEPKSPITTGPKGPKDWSWDGVWERRVAQNLENSLQDSVLYGGMATATNPTGNQSEELIHFLPLEGQELETTTENLLRTIGKHV